MKRFDIKYAKGNPVYIVANGSVMAGVIKDTKLGSDEVYSSDNTIRYLIEVVHTTDSGSSIFENEWVSESDIYNSIDDAVISLT